MRGAGTVFSLAGVGKAGFKELVQVGWGRMGVEMKERSPNRSSWPPGPYGAAWHWRREFNRVQDDIRASRLSSAAWKPRPPMTWT